MQKYVYIKTWGCQMNEYDSKIISSILQKKKYKITDKHEEADILILNTCSIRKKAQEKLFHQLGRWKKIKNKKKKNTLIAVGGCVAEQEGKKIYKRAKYINIIFGTKNIHKLPKMIKLANKKKKIQIDINSQSIEKFDQSTTTVNKFKTTENISIMEGCNKKCSFCIVPYTRGKEISRPHNEIIAEIYQMIKKGVKEIILLGQNVNSYYSNNNGIKCNFAKLLLLISRIPEIKRIKFITSHPKEFTNDIINVYKKSSKISNFLHLPVQSGSNQILKKMKRLYTVKEYKNIIKKLLSARPYMQISSDFIIGFPGERKKNFLKTILLIKKINFDFSYSFLYSKRPNTKASKIIDKTKNSKKKKRLYILQKEINKRAKIWTYNMLGTIQRVLVEKILDNNTMKLIGTTDNNRKIYFYSNTKQVGKMVNIKIINIYKNILFGILINKNI